MTNGADMVLRMGLGLGWHWITIVLALSGLAIAALVKLLRK